MEEMRLAAEGVPQLSGRAAERFAAACACIAPPEPYDKERALQLLAAVLDEQTPIV
ncbi:MAG TPA: beta-hexosaminidase, partial [Hyphomicrobium sp.]|nr:beta-hexosaminidase [Hyphomicrobium sp.]